MHYLFDSAASEARTGRLGCAGDLRAERRHRVPSAGGVLVVPRQSPHQLNQPTEGVSGMSFKMQCPKCKGLDYSIERDNRTFGAVAQAFELVFHCRCGKQMFGEQILKEYEEQKKAWEADTDRVEEAEPAPERQSQREAREQLEQAYEAEAKKKKKVAAKAKPASKKSSKKSKSKASPSKASGKKGGGKSKSADAAGVDSCAWPSCDNPRRKNSKYCSRACSNKNARYRHKMRSKKADKKSSAKA